MSIDSASSDGGASSITAPVRKVRKSDPLGALVSKSLEWCFTFNNYHVDDISRLEGIFKRIGALYVFQREVGESGTPHLQGVVRFSKSLVPMLEFPKFEDHFKKIHWEKCRSWEHSVRYCSKEDSRVDDSVPFTNVDILPVPVLRGWQLVLTEELMPKFEARKVYWFWEPRGGIGKSILVRYLCMTTKALLVSGKDADIKHGVASFYQNNGVGPEFIIDPCPRS